MKLIYIIIIALAWHNAYAQSNKPDTVKQVKIPDEIRRHNQILDSLYAPLHKSSSDYNTICSNHEKVKLVPVAGMIFNNVAFDHTKTLAASMFMNPKFHRGKKTVLFLHLQPANINKATECDSTNLVIITEIKLPEQNDKLEVSENTQLGFYTGISYFPFTNDATGIITLEKTEQDLYKVKLDLKFTFPDQRYRLLKATYHTRIKN